ncbi:MAG: SWIM zinc finger family protein [Archaeoglobus sp.]|nr:SWIM zinc finger family protein [Archaeoglobus sp.]
MKEKESEKERSKRSKFNLPSEVFKAAEKGISYELYKSLLLNFGKRGEKAFNYLKEDRVKKYLDFFVIVGEEEYIVEENFCSCNDFQINLKGKAPCAHIIALKLAKFLGHYKEFDLYYVDYMEKAGKSRRR